MTTPQLPYLRLAWRQSVLLTLQLLVALMAVAGGISLTSGGYTPPISDLEPLGLHSWLVPGVALLGVVALPMLTAAWLVARTSRLAAPATYTASLLLASWVLFEIPFVGFSWLQPLLLLAAAACVYLVEHLAD